MLLLSPALATILIFTTIPALTTLSYAFFKWEGFQRVGFAGAANFQRLFDYPFKDQFLMALRHNTYYGPINMIINDLGFESLAKPWLGSMSTALPTLIFINLWRWVGFPAIIFLAGLNAINQEYLEAARIDGATEGQIFRKIMFPLLAPSLTIITILTFIGAFEWFDLPFVLGGSNGNPAGATDTLALMFYRLSFGSVDSNANEVGVGSALGVFIFLLVGLGAGVGQYFLRKREVEQ